MTTSDNDRPPAAAEARPASSLPAAAPERRLSLIERRVAEAQTKPSLRERFTAVRDRLLADPRFQKRSLANPVTRQLARRHARELFDICAGFVYSQILEACVRLRLFEHLADGPTTVPVLADRIGLQPAAAERLLRAAAALRLAEWRGKERYGLGPLGAALLGNPGIAAMVEHHNMLYDDLRDPVSLLRGESETRIARYWRYAGSDRPVDLSKEEVAEYTGLMAATQSLLADDILETYPLTRHRALLDIGGGDGAFLANAVRGTPGLRGILMELPAVAEAARARFAAEGLGDWIDIVPGNFHTDPLPQGADVVSLVRVLHDHDDAEVLALLEKVRAVLPDTGRLLIAEPLAGTEGAEPAGDAYFGFYLLAMGKGRPRTAGELERLLHRAGYAHVRTLPTKRPILTGLVLARPRLARDDTARD